MELFEEQFTFSQKAADWVAETVGSWKFIFLQTVIFGFWILMESPFQNITGLLFSNRLGSKPDRAIPRSTHSVVRISLLAF